MRERDTTWRHIRGRCRSHLELAHGDGHGRALHRLDTDEFVEAHVLVAERAPHARVGEPLLLNRHLVPGYTHTQTRIKCMTLNTEESTHTQPTFVFLPVSVIVTGPVTPLYSTSMKRSTWERESMGPQVNTLHSQLVARWTPP